MALTATESLPTHRLDKDKRHLTIGQKLIQRKRYNEAIIQFKKALDTNPNISTDMLIFLYKRILTAYDNTSLRHIVATIYAHLNHFKEAVEEAEELVEDAPDHPDTYALLSTIYLKNHQKHRIKQLFELAFSRGIHDSVIVDLLPKIYIQDHQLSHAIALYKTLVDAHDYAQYHTTLIELHAKNQHLDAAVEELHRLFKRRTFESIAIADITKRLTRKYPRHVGLREFYIEVLLSATQPLEAVNQVKKLTEYHPPSLDIGIKWLKNANDHYPHTYEVMLALAELLVRSKHYSEAVVYLQDIFTHLPSKHATLIPVLTTILKHFPEQMMAAKLLSEVYIHNDSIDEYLHVCESLIHINSQALTPDEIAQLETRLTYIPNATTRQQEYAHILLAHLCLSSARYDHALRIASPLVNSDESLAAIMIIAQTHLRQSQTEKAFIILETGLSKHPYHWSIHNALRTCYHATLSTHTDTHGIHELLSHKPFKALSSFQKLPQDFSTMMLTCLTYKHMGRFDLASDYLNEQLSNCHTQKEKHRLLFEIGLNYLSLGKYDQGITELERILREDATTIETILTFYRSEGGDVSQSYAIGCCLLDPLAETPTLIPFVVPQWVKKTKKIDPISFAQSHNNDGVSFLLKQTPNRAIESFSIAQQMDPSNRIVPLNIMATQVLQNTLNPDTLSPQDSDLYNLHLGNWALLKHDLDTARAHFQKALKQNPKNGLAFIGLGDVYYHQKDLKNAFSFWRQALPFYHYHFILKNRFLYLHNWSRAAETVHHALLNNDTSWMVL